MEIIDAQIHVWEDPPAPGRGWDESLGREGLGPVVRIEDAVASMDAIGVYAAVLNVPPHYRRKTSDGFFLFDNTYAEDAAVRYPGRFASAGRVDNADPELEARLQELMRRPGVVAIRVAAPRPAQIEVVKSGGFDRLFRACEDQAVPLMLMAQPYLEVVEQLVKTFPELSLILDHLALPQPSHSMKVDQEPFRRLEQVLSLSGYPNVSVKFSGAPTLSRQDYPFADVWPHLQRYVDAFTPERLMWGSDYTRCRGMHTYSEALDFIRYTGELGDSDKDLILGQSLRRILRWHTPAPGPSCAHQSVLIS